MSRGALAAALTGLGLAAAGLAACPGEEKVPGDLVGSFQFEVELKQDGCGFDGGVEPFAASLSYDPAARRFYLTSGPSQLDGTLEGNAFVVSGRATRTFPSPCGCTGTVEERVEASMYGEAQVAAGGCKAPVVDAGGLLLRDGGSAVQLVCGFLIDALSVAPDASGDCAKCPACLVVYEIAGTAQ